MRSCWPSCAHARRIEVVSSTRVLPQTASVARNPWQQLLSAWRSRGVISARGKAQPSGAPAVAAPRASAPRRTRCAPARRTEARDQSLPRGSVSGWRAAVVRREYGFQCRQRRHEVVGSTTVHNIETCTSGSALPRGALVPSDQTIESWVGRTTSVARSLDQASDRHQSAATNLARSGFLREGRHYVRGRCPSRWTTPPSCIGSTVRSRWQEVRIRRYFRPDRNSRDHEVLGRERVSVAGKSGVQSWLPKFRRGAGSSRRSRRPHLAVGRRATARARDSVEFSRSAR